MPLPLLQQRPNSFSLPAPIHSSALASVSGSMKGFKVSSNMRRKSTSHHAAVASPSMASAASRDEVLRSVHTPLLNPSRKRRRASLSGSEDEQSSAAEDASSPKGSDSGGGSMRTDSSSIRKGARDDVDEFEVPDKVEDEDERPAKVCVLLTYCEIGRGYS